MSNKARNNPGVAVLDPEATERTVRDLLEDIDFRPLSTRSLLLSFLLGTHPPELPVRRLVAFGEHFGVRAGTVRTTLSRMVDSGELTVVDGRYRLAGRLLDRQRRQEEGLRPTDGERWDGSWWTVVAESGERSMADRRQFRAAMLDDRMGELRPEVWLRPANLHVGEAPAGALRFRGPLVDGDPADTARRLWDLDTIEARAARLGGALTMLAPAVAPGAARSTTERLLPLAFDLSAACVRFLRTEPRLPRELVDLPAARSLRADYAAFNERYRRALADYLRDG